MNLFLSALSLFFLAHTSIFCSAPNKVFKDISYAAANCFMELSKLERSLVKDQEWKEKYVFLNGEYTAYCNVMRIINKNIDTKSPSFSGDDYQSENYDWRLDDDSLKN